MTIKYQLKLFDVNLVLPFWILYTDYQTSVVWSCHEYLSSFVHTEYFWLLSRTKTIDSDKIDMLFNVLTDFDIDSSDRVKTDQFNCL